ncbi:MAG TPA: ATP-binding protein, partial [Candidatus Krumholzibacteria bacterium]|nr:ATP-binding protein [Candidatus Krumholzibacteria bacterium]
PAPSSDAARATAVARLGELHGLALARKAAVLAAVGRHNLLMVGPPGTGKTRLARLIGDLQAPLADDEALAVTAIHSAAGLLDGGSLARRRPFRAPHHTTTRSGLVGGGAALRPGEATLAHGGLLFLDELAEFAPAVLDALREPLEDGVVSVVRGYGRRTFPAAFQLVGATNPCRCGRLGDGAQACRCQAAERRRYLSRLSGPLLDRFDLFVEVGAWQGVLPAVLGGEAGPARPGAADGWRRRPELADLDRARRRLAEAAPLGLGTDAAGRLDVRTRQLGLSLRGASRCAAVARTIAALDGAPAVAACHVDEALEFRSGAALPMLEAAGPGA